VFGRRRRRSTFASRRPRRGAPPWLQAGTASYRRQKHRNWTARFVVLGVFALIAAGAAYFVWHQRLISRERDGAHRYALAWSKGDVTGMWNALDDHSRTAYPLARFKALVASANRRATVEDIRLGKPSSPDGGAVQQPVAVRTRLFGTLRGRVVLKVDHSGHVTWSPDMRLPGVRPGEEISRRTGRQPRPGLVKTRGGQPMSGVPALAAFVPGVEKRFARTLHGTPGAELRFGKRLIASVPVHNGHSVHSTMSAKLQAVATSALGNRLGGVAVLRPSDGSVLALAGIADSAPQPPGSTFKMITLTGVLTAHVAKPTDVFPVRTAATLDGVRLANANNESCGGSLVTSFANSCNSVFAPLGARLGAKRLVAMAERFGFNHTPRVPVAKPSTISQPKDLRDSLAVGAAAIGQDKDLATPLEMASVAATIGERGVRADPRVALTDPVVRRRVASPHVAAEVRDMMIEVVRNGTGTAAALPGVTVAGKTGTAELHVGGGASNNSNLDAWFAAFAPAGHPRVAVAVMLVGAGFGGQAAAPIARQVLSAALG